MSQRPSGRDVSDCSLHSTAVSRPRWVDLQWTVCAVLLTVLTRSL